MAFEHKIDSGSIFRNDDRETENHPHYNGSAKIASSSGTIDQYWVSGWINETKSGDKYMSLKFKIKDDNKPKTKRPSLEEEFDGDIPF